MKKYDKILFYIIISLPIIDILTAFTASNILSIGMVARMLLLMLLSVYIFWTMAAKQNVYFSLFLLSFVTIFITFGLAVLFKEPFHFRDEVQFIFKTMYYVVMMFTILVLIQKKLTPSDIIRATKIAGIIVGVSFWLAFLTKTNLKSYAYIKLGYAGWFFSANELSVILIILFCCSIIALLKETNFSSFLSFLLLLSMIPMIGTKTAFYGGFILLLIYVFYLLFTPRQSFDLAVLSVSLLLIISLPLTPFMSNTGADSAVTEELEQTSNTEHSYLSSRDLYLQQTKQDFKKAPLQNKLFGLGYAGNYTKAPKTIEMDFYDLFFSYGFIGTIILLMPFLFVGRKVMHMRAKFTYIFPVLTLALCIGISFVAGHVIFAPAVMSYVAVLTILTAFEARTI